MQYAKEYVFDIKEELLSIMHTHWKDAEQDNSYTFDLDWDSYYALEQSGNMKIYTARKDGNLAGYASVYVTKSLYGKNRIEAHYDSIYVMPKYRAGKTAANFIKYIEQQLVEIGAKRINIATLSHQPFDRLLEWLDYKHTEKVYSKYIG